MSGIVFREECRGAYSGQSDLTLFAEVDGRVVGWIDYSIFRGVPSIQMIEVVERRRGYGTALVCELQRRNPGVGIEWGGMTPEGAALYAALPKREVPNEGAQAAQLELAQVKARIAEHNARWRQGPLSDEMIDDWNEQISRAEDLERELQRMPLSVTLVGEGPANLVTHCKGPAF